MGEPKVVGRYLARTQADVARCTLEGAGIPAYLADENMTRVAWLYSIALGGARLYVPEEFEEEARALLAAPAQGAPTLGEITRGKPPRAEAADRCPRCGLSDVQYTDHDRRLRALSLLLLWLGIPFLAWRRKTLGCADCGEEWRPAPDRAPPGEAGPAA